MLALKTLYMKMSLKNLMFVPHFFRSSVTKKGQTLLASATKVRELYAFEDFFCLQPAVVEGEY